MSAKPRRSTTSSSPAGEPSSASADSTRSILITGGAGFVGTHLARTLLEQGHTVYVVDNLITGRRENAKALEEYSEYQFIEADIAHNSFAEMFDDIPVQQIFHLACPTGVPNIKLLGLEMLQTCSIGTLQVLEIARRHQASLLFTSSCEVYGQPEISPQTTSYNGNVNPIGPRSPYEEGKRFSESAVITYVRQFGIDGKIVRIFNTYGPGMSPEDQRVLPRFLKKLSAGEDLEIYGDGSQNRTFLYVDDLIAAFTIIMSKADPGSVFNIGGTEQLTIREVAEVVLECTGSTQNIQFSPHFTEDHLQRLPDTSALQALGWKPTVPFAEGVQRMVDWYQETCGELVTKQPALNTMAA